MTALRRIVVALVASVALLAALIRSADAREIAQVFSVDGTEFSIDAADGMGGFVEAARAVVEQKWAHVAQAAGVAPGAHIDVHIERDFADYFEREGVPSRAPEWAAGLALPSRRVILLAPGNPTWESTLVHEMSHVAVAVAAGDGELPAWFQEGFAVAVAEQWGLERATTMMHAGVTGSFHDFRQLERGFPAARSMADLAYAQSFHLVHRMQGRFGDDVFRRALAQVAAGKSFSEAFAATTGTLLTVAYDDWARGARTRYRWMPMFAGGGAVWGVVIVVGVLAWRRKRRRQRERLASMEALERGVWSRDDDDRTFG